MTRRLLLVSCSAAVLLLATACGQQTDDRVQPESTAAVQSEIPAVSPFVTLDCATLQADPAEAPPADATTIGAASAVVQADGVPTITIATDAAPATELGVADLLEGDGAEAQPGDTLTFNYCGAGYVGQGVFDSSWSRGEPLTYPLPQLIRGWQEGIPGMKVGGQRLLVIPGELGYGETGTQGIAPNETLVFVIQLESIG